MLNNFCNIDHAGMSIANILEKCDHMAKLEGWSYPPPK